MLYFIATIEKIIVEGLVRLFKDNIWKLHRLLESMILNRGLSSLQMVDLVSLYFIFHFHFIFILFSYFSIFRT